MTARDLLQQRTTSPSGDTAWRFSPLVVAALEGSLAVLDGVHRVNAGTFAVLQRYDCCAADVVITFPDNASYLTL